MDRDSRDQVNQNASSRNPASGIAPDANLESLVSRRRALLAGLATAPAILTLMRRPVWAQEIVVSDALCASLDATTSLHGDNDHRQALQEACDNRDSVGTTDTTETTDTTTEP